jgi:hypothetical protein
MKHENHKFGWRIAKLRLPARLSTLVRALDSLEFRDSLRYGSGTPDTRASGDAYSARLPLCSPIMIRIHRTTVQAVSSIPPTLYRTDNPVWSTMDR